MKNSYIDKPSSLCYLCQHLMRKREKVLDGQNIHTCLKSLDQITTDIKVCNQFKEGYKKVFYLNDKGKPLDSSTDPL